MLNSFTSTLYNAFLKLPIKPGSQFRPDCSGKAGGRWGEAVRRRAWARQSERVWERERRALAVARRQGSSV